MILVYPPDLGKSPDIYAREFDLDLAVRGGLENHILLDTVCHS